jgi:hypothetical protein
VRAAASPRQLSRRRWSCISSGPLYYFESVHSWSASWSARCLWRLGLRGHCGQRTPQPYMCAQSRLNPCSSNASPAAPATVPPSSGPVPFPPPPHDLGCGAGWAGIPLSWGEVSLAHCGMLCLGELPALHPHVRESLYEPVKKHFRTVEPRHIELSGKSGRILVRLVCERPGPIETRRPPAALHVRHGGEP